MKRDRAEPGVNPLCGTCVRSCRQTQGTLLVDCPRFRPRPFKIKPHRFEQLDLFKNG